VNFKTIRDAAAALGVAESKLRRDVAAGTVPSMKLGTRAVVDIDAVADLLQKPEGVGIEAVSAETGLSVSAIRRAVREGWMPCDKPGKAYLFQMDKVHAAIDERVREQTRKIKR